MITRQDLMEAIAECQGTRSPNSSTAVKLAAFYTILDHMEDPSDARPVDPDPPAGYSFAGPSAPTVDYTGNSEFAQAISGKPQEDIWPVLDELMSTLKIINERLYNSVMRKL